MYKVYCIRILFFLLLVCTSNKAGALVRYVKPVASGTASGLSWANASADLQGIINASTSGDEVWVAAGTYLPSRDPFGNTSPNNPRDKTFFLKSGVNVYGGFIGNESTITARNISANHTILSGDIGTVNNNNDNCYHVVMFVVPNTGTTGCVFDGFRVKDGLANSSGTITISGVSVPHSRGAGIYANGGLLTVFRNNHVYNNLSSGYGGGISLKSGGFSIRQDSVYNNRAYWGGGLYTESCTDTVYNNAFYGNSAANGGGIYFNNPMPLYNNVIFNNSSSRGGGGVAYLTSGNATCYGNIVYNNYSDFWGGGFLLEGGNYTSFNLINNVIFNNTSAENGGGVFTTANYCIYYNNTFYNNVSKYSNGTGGVAHRGHGAFNNNIFWRNMRNNVVADVDIFPFYTVTTTNNIAINPLFVDTSKPLGIDGVPGTGDDGLRLTLCSPAVNAGGTINPAILTDVIGNSRVGNYDIGAYEYQGAGPIHASAITGDSAFCLNGNMALSNTIHGGVWSSSDTSVAPISSAGVLTGKALGTTAVTYVTDNSGCPSSIAKKNVRVTTFTPVNAITGPDSVCSSKTIQLSNTTPGGLWVSGDTSIAKVNDVGLVTGTGDDIVTISYIKGPHGCSTVASKIVTVGLTPAVTPISGNPIEYLCTTDTVLYTNATPGGIWSTKSNGIIADVSSNGLLTPIKRGTDSLKYTVTTLFGCMQEVKKMISITTPSIHAKDSIVGRDSLCIGDTIYLGHTLQPYLWEHFTSWKSDNPAVAVVNRPGKGTIVVTGVSAGTAKITYSVRDGNCDVQISKMITVVGPPAVAAITGANMVCQNSAMYVANSTPGGVWKVLDPNPVFSVDTSGLIIPQKLGMGTVSYIIANHMGCADTIHKQISVAKEPTRLPINGPDSICSQEETLLTNVWTGYWFSSDTLTATVDSGGVVKGIGAGMATINYRVINSSGCTSVIDKNIFVKELPKVWPIVGSAIACKNSTQQYTNVTKGGVWSTWSVNIISSISQSGLLQAYSRGTDTVFYTVTNELGCSTVVHSPISVNVPESIPITGSEKACTGYSEQFAHAVTDGKWSVYKKTAAKISGSGVYLSKTAGTDSVFYEYRSNSCPIQVRKAVMVNRTPDTAVIYGEKMVCKFESLQLSSTFSDGAWASTDNAIALIDQQGLVYGKDAGIAVLNYIRVSSAGCSSSAVYQIQVSKPNADVEQDGTQLQVMSRLHGIGYQWVDCDNNYQAIPGATESYYEALKNGKYAVVVTYKGCDDTSACLSITTLGNNPTDEYPLIFPNPSSDNITINTGNKIAIEIRLFDAVGRRVGTIIPSGPVTMVSVSHLLPGIYQVQLNIDGETIIRKLIVL